MIPKELLVALFISCPLFCMFFIFKGFLSTAGLVFTLCIGSIFLENDDIRLVLLILLNILSLYMCRIKAIKMEISYKAILNPPILILTFILTTLATVIKNKTTLALMDILEAILLGATFTFFFVVIVICSYRVAYKIYLCSKYPSKSIVSLEISKLSRITMTRSFPLNLANFKINKSVKIYAINIDSIAYFKAKRGHKLNITKYKTDGKGNFILF